MRMRECIFGAQASALTCCETNLMTQDVLLYVLARILEEVVRSTVTNCFQLCVSDLEGCTSSLEF